jgi:hypothetical protein
LSTGVLIVFVVAAALAGGLYWLYRIGRRIEARERAGRAERAQILGWEYDDTRRGDIDFVLRGRAGEIEWELAYESDRGSENPTASVKWSTASVKAGEPVLAIMGRWRYDFLRGIGGKVLFGLAKALIRGRGLASGESSTQGFLEAARDLPGGSPGFRKYFVVLGRDDRLAHAIMDAQLETLLMDWPAGGGGVFGSEKHLEIWADPGGVRVVVHSGLTDMPRLEHVVTLGVTVAERLRKYLASRY